MINTINIPQYCRKPGISEVNLLTYLIVYFYGSAARKVVEDIDHCELAFCYSRKTGRLRSILYKNELFASIRASDFRLIPHIPLATLLYKSLPFPRHRVVIVNEIVPDVLESHTVFSKHVIYGDESIKPFDEVLIVDEEDNLVGLGRAIISYEAMITSLRGPAVQVREKVKIGGNEKKI
ncbi:MAG: PUA domain-containing protein [Ignisphaera sp.]